MPRPLFSIRYKFLMVATILLMFCVVSYLTMATTVIRSDKTSLVFDYNKSLVTNLASEVQTLLQNASDKVELAAHFFRTKNESSLQRLQDLMKQSPDLAFVVGSDDFKSLSKIFHEDENYLKTYGLEREAFRELVTSSLPFERIKTEGEVLWSVPIPNGPPLIGYGKSVIEENQQGQVEGQYAVFVFLKADSLLRAAQKDTSQNVFMINDQGQVLVHSDRDVLDGKKIVPPEVIHFALKSPVRVSVMKVDTAQGALLGGVAKSFRDQSFVISTVNESDAFAVVDRLMFRSLLFALMVLTLAFIAAILFSRSLTRPIEDLVGGMKKVAQGDLQSRIQIQSRDEIRLLAENFNSMIGDLQESRNQLEEANRTLEAKVQERTLQLEKQNQAVKDAQEALLRTTRLAAVGEIAGRAAHEVLNPLTSILSRVQKVRDRIESQIQAEIHLLTEITQAWKTDFEKGGFAGLVQKWQEPSQVKTGETLWSEDLNNLEAIEGQILLQHKSLLADTEFLIKESERINRIVQSMRGLSMIKSEKRVFILRHLVEEAVNVMADLASKEGITIVHSSPEDEIKVCLDKDEFLQSVTNLLRNSIQAIVEKKKRGSSGFRGLIQVHVLNQNQDVQILIEDNGVGISVEDQKKLFTSQFTTKDRASGTGLGLNISRRFIRAFGGDINLLSSQSGESCSFVISLPRYVHQERKAS